MKQRRLFQNDGGNGITADLLQLAVSFGQMLLLGGKYGIGALSARCGGHAQYAVLLDRAPSK